MSVPFRRTASFLMSGLLVTGGLALPLLAQAPGGTAPADSADVGSVDAILTAVYDVISGPAGQARDWDRFRALHVDDARLIPTFRNRESGVTEHRVWTVEEYIERAGAQLEARGFFEREIARRTERYGNIVHAFSTYESRFKADDPAPFMRGINSVQLLHQGGRWWIVTIFWQPEYPDLPIPAEYLTSAGE